MRQLSCAKVCHEELSDWREIDISKLLDRNILHSTNRFSTITRANLLCRNSRAVIRMRPVGESFRVPLFWFKFNRQTLARRRANRFLRFFRSINANRLLDFFAILLEESIAFNCNAAIFAYPLRNRVGDMHLAEVIIGRFIDRFFDVAKRDVLHATTLDNRLAHAIEAAPLVLHWFVVLENVLALLEVALFDLSLRLLNRAREHRVFEVVAFLHPQGAEHFEHRFAREQLHEFVVHRQKEAT